MRSLLRGVLGAVIAAAVTLAVWIAVRPAPEPAPVAPATTEAERDQAAAGPDADPVPGPDQASVEPVPAEPAPSFDVVRIAPDGQAVIAGRAAPGETVEIVLDGTVIATAETDASGAFAMVLEIPPSGEARELMLRAPRAGGEAGTTLAAAPGAEAEPAAGTTRAEAADPTALPAAEGTVPTGLAAADPSAPAAPSAPAVTAPAPAAAPAVDPATDSATSAAAPPAGGPAEVPATPPAQTPAPGEATPAMSPAPDSATPGQAAPASALSRPLVILPGEDATAPAVIRPDDETVTLLQPAFAVSGAGIVLDRITYEDAGDIVAAGRGRPGALIRVYVNAEYLTEARFGADGQWQVRVPREVAADTLLLRFDEIGAEGQVVSRLETPFEYSPGAVAHELRDRKIVVQRGDYLWKFAEQYYGRGIRYSVIYQANAHLIRDPDLIYPGQIFTVPELVTSD